MKKLLRMDEKCALYCGKKRECGLGGWRILKPVLGMNSLTGTDRVKGVDNFHLHLRMLSCENHEVDMTEIETSAFPVFPSSSVGFDSLIFSFCVNSTYISKLSSMS